MSTTLAFETSAAPARRVQAATGLATEIAIIDDAGAFLALRDEWNALFARCAGPQQVFQSHVVLSHWIEHYLSPRDRLCIVIARREGRLVMAWPLWRQRRFGLRLLRFMGTPVSQFGDVLVERGGPEAQLLRLGWETVCALPVDIMELRKIRADSALALLPLPAEAVLLEERQSPMADLALRVGAEGPGTAYGPRERSNHRRRLRRLSERGAIAFEQHTPGPLAATLVRQAVAMKCNALTRHAVIAPAIADPRFSAFFAGLAADAASPLRLTVIRCDGAPIAIDISFDCKQTAFGHVLATHADHERGGVGGLLVHRAFANAKERGNMRFDLLAPADPYKREHADDFTRVGDFLLPLSLAGRLICGLGLRHLRPTLKTALRRMPPIVTRQIASWSGAGKN